MKYKFKQVVGRGLIVLVFGTVLCTLFAEHFSDLRGSMIYTAIKYKFKQVVGIVLLLGIVFCTSFTVVCILQTYVAQQFTLP